MKVYFYLIIIVGLMLLLNLAGVSTTEGYVLSQLGLVNNPENLQNTNFYTTILLIITGVAIGGIAIGFFVQAALPFYVFVGFIPILLLFLGDMISIIKYVDALEIGWVKYIVILIMAPLCIGYILAVFEFWRGGD